MLQFTVEHPGHNLHILMGMRAEPRVGCHHVIVAHQKQSMMGVVGIVVVRKAETVVRIEPANFGVKPLMASVNIYLGS
jgi:RNase P/RNase MRP subunit p29